MITYNKGAFGLNLIWRLHGSSVYRAMIPGFFALIVYLLIHLVWRDETQDNSDDLGHPYAIGVLVGSVSFLIVFRANHGYNRYWEACGAIHGCLSKWMDATAHVASFHMQCSHYDGLRPPSFFDHPELNSGFYTRDRERGVPEDLTDSDSVKRRTLTRAISKSINFIEDSRKRQLGTSSSDGINIVDIPEHEEVLGTAITGSFRSSFGGEPRPLLGRGRLDGGWGKLYNDGSSTFHNPKMEWNHDGKGFASTAGGRTPALFLQELAHLSSLLTAVALSTLRNDVDGAESPLDVYIPGASWPEADPSLDVNSNDTWWKYLTGADRTPDARTQHNASHPLLVIGGVSDNEIRFLQRARGPLAKTQLAWHWLSEFIIREHLAGSLGEVGSPIISRVMQFLGDGMLPYNHARKIMWIPFPFPHAQLSIFYVITMMFTVPFLMDQYARETWLGSLLTFLTVTCLVGLHEVARELENPFRNIPNDLPVCTMQAHYNEALTTIYSGYHPDSFWDPDQEGARKKMKNKVEKAESAPPVDTFRLQSVVEEQGREIERLKALVLASTQQAPGENGTDEKQK